MVYMKGFLSSPYFDFLCLKRMASSNNEENSSSVDANQVERPKYKNRLSLERSPYLLQHASNPVDW